MDLALHQQLWSLLEPVVGAMGFDLVEIEYLHQKDWVLRVFIDLPDLEVVPGLGVVPGAGVGLGDCVEVSRELSALLDVEDLIPHSYRLEVSSPGARRPLRKPSDFRRFVGCPMSVRTRSAILPEAATEASSARRKLRGELTAADSDAICIVLDAGLYRIPYQEIVKAQLEPDMERWMSLAIRKRKEPLAR